MNEPEKKSNGYEIEKIAALINQMNATPAPQEIRQPQQPRCEMLPVHSFPSNRVIRVGDDCLTASEYTALMPPHEKELVAGDLVKDGYGKSAVDNLVEEQTAQRIGRVRWEGAGIGIVGVLGCLGLLFLVSRHGVPAARFAYEVAQDQGVIASRKKL